MNRRIYLIILYLATVLICVAAVSRHVGRAVSGCAGCIEGTDIDISIPVTKLSGENIDETFDVSSFEDITIKGCVADLTIEEGEDYSVTYSGDKSLKPEVSVRNGKLIVEQSGLRVNNSKLPKNADICIKVRKGQIGDLDINSDVGDVYVKNVSGKKLNADLAVGTIYMKNSDFSDKVKIDAQVGEIRMDRCKTGELSLDASVGSITINGIECKDADIDSHVGSIDISGIKNDDYDFNVKCSLGDFTYNGKGYGKNQKINNVKSKYTVKINSDIGDVDIDAD